MGYRGGELAHGRHPSHVREFRSKQIELLFGLPAGSDVHDRTNKLEFARRILHGASNDTAMLDRAIGHQQPPIELPIPPLMRYVREKTLHDSALIRMNSFQHQCQRGLCGPVVAKDSESLLRPDNLAGGD